MREAVGGAYLFYFVIGFLLLYVFFMGFVMNYASTYRAANYIVTQIEVCQAEKDCNGITLDKLKQAVKEKYRYVESTQGAITVCCLDNGNGSVYRVIMPVDFDMPLLGRVTGLEVKAETKTILNKSCDSDKVSEDYNANRCK